MEKLPNNLSARDCAFDLDDVDGDSLENLRRVGEGIAKDTLATVNRLKEPVTPSQTIYARYGKRAVDIVLALPALVLTAPINMVCALLTLVDVGVPILFRQERVGKDGKPFEIIKFRNMTNETDCDGNLLPPSQRTTKFGKIMRRTSLDELLNFWSILKGDMSIIGPRPLPPIYDSFLSNRHKCRQLVRPGLECPSVRPPYRHVTWEEQFENDVWYVENLSLATDIKMFIALVRTMLDRKGTAVRAGATRGSFVGYNMDGTSINSHAIPNKYLCLVDTTICSNSTEQGDAR